MSEEKMKAFINELFDEYYPECGDIDGSSLQDMAEKHGILVPEIRYEPCGEFCNCNELVYDEEWQEGVKCYRLANWLSAEHSVQLTGLESPPKCTTEKLCPVHNVWHAAPPRN